MPQIKEKPSKGHYICGFCGEYIRPEKGDRMVRLEYGQKAHKRCKDAGRGLSKTEVNHMVKKEKDIPITTSEAKEVAKATKIAKKAPEKSALNETETKVLEFITNLDHPATSNEVRDQFGFPLRANARVIFKKLAKLGLGENRKEGNRYRFYVKGKEYPESTR